MEIQVLELQSICKLSVPFFTHSLFRSSLTIFQCFIRNSDISTYLSRSFLFLTECRIFFTFPRKFLLAFLTTFLFAYGLITNMVATLLLLSTFF